MADFEQAILASLESSGQFTPEQRVAIARAILVGINVVVRDQMENFEEIAKRLGISDEELRSLLP